MMRTGNRNSYVNRAAALALTAMLACGVGATGDQKPLTTGQSNGALSGQWLLLSSATDEGLAAIQGIPENRRALFEVDHTYDEATQRVVPTYRATGTVVMDRTYWVYASEGPMPDPGSMVMPPPPLPPEPGRFIQITKTTPKAEVGHRIYRWNDASQELTLLDAGDVPPGTYWVDQEDGCGSGDWRFGDAIRLVRRCALNHTPLAVIPKNEWSTASQPEGTPESEDSNLPKPKTLVLHHTETPQDMSIQDFEAHTLNQSESDELGYDFVLAKNEQRIWQVYQGRPLKASQTEVHIAIMGNYEPAGEGLTAPKNPNGYLETATESERQPPAGAVVKLTQLVSELSDEFESLEALVPFGQGFDALEPGASTSPGRGALHLSWSLHDRFFAQRSAEAPSVSFETEDHVSHVRFEENGDENQDRPVDRIPPLLFVAEPASKVIYSKTSTVTLMGEVYDENLTQFSVNGIVLGSLSRSFEQAIWLNAGENIVTLFAIDAFGNTTEVQKQIIYDDTPPQISLTEPTFEEIARGLFGVHGQVHDHSLQNLTINGRPLDTVNDRFVKWFDTRALEDGFYPYEVVATDEIGHRSSASFALEVESGSVRYVPHPHTPAQSVDHDANGSQAIGFYVDMVAGEEQTYFDIIVRDWNQKEEHIALTEVLAEGASPQWKRAYVFFDDLSTVNTSSVAAVEIENVLPATSELSWHVTPFGADDAPHTPGEDPIMPELSISHPSEELSFTRASSVTLRGRVHDENLKMVRIDQVILGTVSGPFETLVELKQERTDFSVIVQDMTGNEVTLTRTVIQDANPPRLSLSGHNKDKVYQPEYTLSGSVQDRYLAEVALVHLTHTGRETLEVSNGRFSQTVTLTEGLNQFSVIAKDRAGNLSSQQREVYYTPAESFVASGRTEPPPQIFGWSRNRTVFLQWEAPRRFETGKPLPPGIKLRYRIYRDEVEIHEQEELTYQGELPEAEKAYGFYVTALIPGAQDNLESGRSERIRVEAGKDVRPSELGEFEAPSEAEVAEFRASTPILAVSEAADGTPYTHLTYVARGDGKRVGDQIRYLRSHKLAKSGSWAHSHTIRKANTTTMITDVAMAARGSQLVIAWIEVPTLAASGSERISEILAAKSQDSGQTFGDPILIKKSPVWKRSLSVGIDRLENSHLVFGEGNKVFYAKNLELETTDQGEPRSVFDQRNRRPANEVVKYMAKYSPRPDKGCDCPGCWCEEDYEVSTETNPKTGLPFGEYIEWTSDTFVYEPSLDIDDEKVSIVARQTQEWNAVPVINPAWKKMYDEDPIYSDDIVVVLRPTKRLVGWRNIWKRAYEPGDENLWSSVGIDYQYLYEGTEQTQDIIKLAQRPLTEGAWNTKGADDSANASERGWAQGAWVDDQVQNWRMGDVRAIGQGEAQEKPSHPKVTTAPNGLLVVTYEEGPSENPNQVGQNAIVVTTSEDGGLVFDDSRVVAQGYMPSLAITEKGDRGLVYYHPGQAKNDQGNTASIHAIQYRDGAWTDTRAISVSPPQPIHRESHGKETDFLHGVPHMVSYKELLIAAWVQPSRTGHDQDSVVISRALLTTSSQNHIDVRTANAATERQPTPVTIECLNEYHMYAQGCTDAGELALRTGEQTFNNPLGEFSVTKAYVPLTTTGGVFKDDKGNPLPVGRSSIEVLQGGNQVFLGIGEKGSPAEHSIALIQKHAGGNYFRATEARENLYDPDQNIQREFIEDPNNTDSIPLERYKRVWAYTQGITLAQLTRQHDPKAGPLAHALCDEESPGIERGEFNGQPVVKGWHFSWNTERDKFKDFRLVTGATAWTIHGLGIYLAAQVERHGQVPPADQPVAECYGQAIRGLAQHRKTVTKGNLSGELMTAGWTALGLVMADSPSRLDLTEDEEEHWPYYGILDAIGDAYNAEKPAPITPYKWVNDAKVFLDPITLSEAQYDALRVETQAANTVTEHNLDVLSVLNHAIKHADDLGLDKTELTSWRNDLRDAIFTLLWDPQQKRIVTGGDINELGELLASTHSAIDNCSWLALSVDYQTLPQEHALKLGECLQFTRDNFVRPLDFLGKTYYGTHYFKNDFRDPYIEESQLQEDTYHLEATAGMILGLLYFADNNPEHTKANFYRSEAAKMWADMQIFVQDNGFPYASERIQDLSTLLESSTAIVWFMDVYDYYHSQYTNQDQPLQNYARGFDVAKGERLVARSWEMLEAKGSGGHAPLRVNPSVQTEAPSGRVPLDSYAQRQEGARQVVTLDGEFKLRGYYWVNAVPDLPESIHEAYASDLWTYAPVNEANIWVELGVVESRVSIFRSKRTFIFEGGISFHGALSGGNPIILLSILKEGQEWIVGTAELEETTASKTCHRTSDVPEDCEKSFSFQLSQRVPNLGWGQPDLGKGRPVARLIHKKIIDADRFFAPHDILASTHPTPVHSTPVDGTSEVKFRHEGKIGEWSFSQPITRDSKFDDWRFVLHEVSPTNEWSPIGSMDEAEALAGSIDGLLASETLPIIHDGAHYRLTTEGEPGTEVTYLQDQAFAIVAAVNRGETSLATRWAYALVDTLQPKAFKTGVWRQFPFAVDSKTGKPITPYLQTSTQMKAVYALAWYLQHVGRDKHIEEAIVNVLEAVVEIYSDGSIVDLDRVLLSGVGSPEAFNLLAENPEPIEPEIIETINGALRAPHNVQIPVAAYEDHVYAYFAVDLAARVLGKDYSMDFAIDLKSDIEIALQLSHSFHSRHKELAIKPFVTPSQRKEIATIVASALYPIVNLELGPMGYIPESAAHLSAVLNTQALSQSLHRSAPSQDLFRTPAGIALARRAIGLVDPRSEQLAWLAFDKLGNQSPANVREATAALLLNDPKGFLGISASPIITPAPSDIELVDEVIHPETLMARLELHYAELVLQLLAMDYRPYNFDEVLRDLAMAQAATFYATDFQPINTWLPLYHSHHGFQHYVEAVASELGDACEGYTRNLRIAERIGMRCSDLSAQFGRLLKRRTGSTDPTLLPSLIEPQDEAFKLAQLIGILTDPLRPVQFGWSSTAHAKDRSFFGHVATLYPGNGQNLFSRLTSQDPVTLPQDPNSRQVQQAYRAHIEKTAKDQAVEPYLDGGYFDVKAFSWIDVSNPASALQGSRSLIEYRQMLKASQDQSQHAAVNTLPRGDLTDVEPRLSSLPSFGNNPKHLRRLLNAHAKGHLVSTAAAAGLEPGVLHAALHQGILTSTDFYRIAAALQLSEKDTQNWASQFVLDEAADLVGFWDVTVSSQGLMDAHALAVTGEAYEEPALEPEAQAEEALLAFFDADADENGGCYAVYRFDDRSTPPELFVLLDEEQSNAYIIEPCYQGPAPYRDDEVAQLAYTQNEPLSLQYAVRKVGANPWADELLAGAVVIPAIPGFGSASHGVLVGSPAGSGFQVFRGNMSDDHQITLHHEVPEDGCQQVLKVPTPETSIVELFADQTLPLGDYLTETCFFGNSLAVDAEAGWTYVFVGQNTPLSWEAIFHDPDALFVEPTFGNEDPRNSPEALFEGTVYRQVYAGLEMEPGQGLRFHVDPDGQPIEGQCQTIAMTSKEQGIRTWDITSGPEWLYLTRGDDAETRAKTFTVSLKFGESSHVDVCLDPAQREDFGEPETGALSIATDGLEPEDFVVEVTQSALWLPKADPETTFEEQCTPYEMKNIGKRAIQWAIGYPDSWMRITYEDQLVGELSKFERTLEPNQSASIRICHRLAENSKSVDASSRVWFYNQTDGVNMYRVFRVTDGKDSPIDAVASGNHLEETIPCRIDQRAVRDLSSDYWAYEMLPSAITSDGTQPIVVQVTAASQDIDAIYLKPFSNFTGPDGEALGRIDLNDRGEGADKYADDHIYTGGPMYYAGWGREAPANWYPVGIGIASVGELHYESRSMGDGRFDVDPQIGVVDAQSIAVSGLTHAGGLVATSNNLINVCSSSHTAEMRIRQTSSSQTRKDAQKLTREIYGEMGGDLFEFLNVMSTYHVERIGGDRYQNVSRGSHTVVYSDVDNIGLAKKDDRQAYGAGGSLLGISYASYMNGIDSANFTHEMMHQWGAYLLEGSLSDNGSHYREAVGQASLLRGHHWQPHGDGYVIDCGRLVEGLSEATPLDKYLMGLIPAGDVDPFMLSDSDNLSCNSLVTDVQTIDLERDIIPHYGVRSPGPASVHFRIGFVAESLGRFLTPTEKTFYEAFAKEYARPVSGSEPLPAVIPNQDDTKPGNWVSIAKFFGDKANFSTNVPKPGTVRLRPISQHQPDSTPVSLDEDYDVKPLFDFGDEGEASRWRLVGGSGRHHAGLTPQTPVLQHTLLANERRAGATAHRLRRKLPVGRLTGVRQITIQVQATNADLASKRLARRSLRMRFTDTENMIWLSSPQHITDWRIHHVTVDLRRNEILGVMPANKHHKGEFDPAQVTSIELEIIELDPPAEEAWPGMITSFSTVLVFRAASDQDPSKDPLCFLKHSLNTCYGVFAEEAPAVPSERVYLPLMSLVKNMPAGYEPVLSPRSKELQIDLIGDKLSNQAYYAVWLDQYFKAKSTNPALADVIYSSLFGPGAVWIHKDRIRYLPEEDIPFALSNDGKLTPAFRAFLEPKGRSQGYERSLNDYGTVALSSIVNIVTSDHVNTKPLYDMPDSVIDRDLKERLRVEESKWQPQATIEPQPIRPEPVTKERVLEFSGYLFSTKDFGRGTAGPGPNYWSGDEKNVRVDENGSLHLAITQDPKDPSIWYSSEIISKRSFGHGRYTFVVEVDLPNFDARAVLGLFTWDATRPEARPHYNSEIDVELSYWGGEKSSMSSQFAMPPYGVLDGPWPPPIHAIHSVPPEESALFRRRFRPNDDLLSDHGSKMTYVFDWQDDVIHFGAYYGDKIQADKAIETWTFAQSKFVQPEGEENLRMNLWLMRPEGIHSSEPAETKPVSAIVHSFKFEPAPDKDKAPVNDEDAPFNGQPPAVDALPIHFDGSTTTFMLPIRNPGQYDLDLTLSSATDLLVPQETLSLDAGQSTSIPLAADGFRLTKKAGSKLEETIVLKDAENSSLLVPIAINVDANLRDWPLPKNPEGHILFDGFDTPHADKHWHKVTRGKKNDGVPGWGLINGSFALLFEEVDLDTRDLSDGNGFALMWTGSALEEYGRDFTGYSKIAFDVQAVTESSLGARVRMRLVEGEGEAWAWTTRQITEVGQYQTFTFDFSHADWDGDVAIDSQPIKQGNGRFERGNIYTISFVFTGGPIEDGVFAIDNLRLLP